MAGFYQESPSAHFPIPIDSEKCSNMYHMQSASQWIVLARILRPQGRKGEVLADLFTDFPKRFQSQSRVWLAPQGFADSSSANLSHEDQSSATPLRVAEVASHWIPLGRNAGRIVLSFSGIDTIEKAERLAGYEVLVPLAERTPLDSSTAYISDLIGCTVYDHDQPLGAVASVQFPTSPDGLRRLDDAAPLLAVITPSGDELLVPFVGAFLLALDPAAKSIRMALPEGLAQLNLQSTTQPNRAAAER
jgi:16S rRNA processing protein RimM